MGEKIQQASRHQVFLWPQRTNAQGWDETTGKREVGKSPTLLFSFLPKQKKINASQLSSGRTQNKGGIGGAKKCLHMHESLRTSNKRYSQLAEAVKPGESTTGVLYCARNLVMVQIPGEKTRAHHPVWVLNFFFSVSWQNRLTPNLSPLGVF